MLAKVVLALSSLAACFAFPVLPGTDTARTDITFASILEQVATAKTVRRQWIRTNEGVDESKIVVAKRLREDGRIGKIVDSQGIVTLRPMTSSRWTPVAGEVLLKPGDWLRTDVRGANAATVSTTSDYKVIVGPGSLVELLGAGEFRLHDGEMKVTGRTSAEGKFQVLGPKEQSFEITAGQSDHYRIDRHNNLVKVEKAPKWLAGFEGSSNDESIGSLICNVDGRSVPLSVGFHRVKVEIRDQIARTTIEESFVNHTRTQLEGTFHFPLPQDASISGFGMWIGGELIEADVVEKQRAREIYETILRERRDPGLLEWSGGNIFKARVFPIPARSEKRIRIVYTQVLPMRASRYRYSYGLRSELLQKTPIRDLSLDVLVHSALPLKSVHCSTHDVRSQQTKNSATIEFTAQEYTPTRDFEVVCEIDGSQSDVVVIPHQRGEDGYFVVQLTPPGAEGNWQREILPDGESLELLLVCDTSASMDSEKRKQQQQFVTSVLSSLGPKDRFNIAVVDVDCEWLHGQSVAPSQQMNNQAIAWLEKRVSLGWTDLDSMAESVLQRMGNPTQVVYVGDGIVTARDADPQSFVNRLNRMAGGHQLGTFHAVSVGNSYESTTLKAVASIGGGSVRQIGGEQTPSKIAFELLSEIAQPGLRNLKIDFRGLQVAAVYPDQLPNLAAGAQHILIGRYLPGGDDQSGEIVVTGTRGDEQVRYVSRIRLKDAEKGNSFIPRLWARAHLDHLLQQGDGQFVKDEIIALSEQFHIITPYTSLLVLETDEDRERFGVVRRYQMRDGERFFADGNDSAKFALRKEQMKRAGDWRIGLRRQVLATLSGLGRDAEIFQQLQQLSTNLPMSGPIGGDLSGIVAFDGSARISGVAGGSGGFINGTTVRLPTFGFSGGYDFDFAVGGKSNRSSSRSAGQAGEKYQRAEILDELEQLEEPGDLFSTDELSDFEEQPFLQQQSQSEFKKRRISPWNEASKVMMIGDRRRMISDFGDSFRLAEKSKRISSSLSRPYGGQYDVDSNRYVQWLDTLFPIVPATSQATEPLKSDWPADAIELSKSLVQPIAVDGEKDETGDDSIAGIEVRRQTVSSDPRWNRVTGDTTDVQLYTSNRWLEIFQSAASDVRVQWCNNEHRGSYSLAFQLGRQRKSSPRDLEMYVPGQRAHAVTPLHHSYRQYGVTLERRNDGEAVLTLGYPKSNPTTVTRLVIDATKSVVLSVEQQYDNQLSSATNYRDYVKVAGVWWPRNIVSSDHEGRTTSETKQTITALSKDAFERRYLAELPAADQSQIIPMPLPTVRASEIALADGSGVFANHLTLLLRGCLIQKWSDVLQQLAELEKIAGDKPGMAWIRIAVQIAARQNEDARQLLVQQADRVVASKPIADLFLANFIVGQTAQVGDANERLRQLDRLRGVYDRQQDAAGAVRDWMVQQTTALRELQRSNEVLAQQLELATTGPWDIPSQITYAQDLIQSGDLEAALAWLRHEWIRPQHRDYESSQLRSLYANSLRQRGRDDDLVDFLKDWMAEELTNQQVYQQYLHALWMADRTDAANATVRDWLKNGRVEGKLEPDELEKLNAATAYARGQRYQTYMNWIDPQWLGPLQETAIFFLEHEHHFTVASSIIDDHRFIDSDESDRVRTVIADRLAQSADQLEPTLVASFVRWTIHRNALTVKQWTQIARTLRGRWEAAEEDSEWQLFDSSLMQIYSTHFSDSEQLRFMRNRIELAEEKGDSVAAATHARALFDELLTRPWSADHESEAIALLNQTTASTVPSTALLVRVDALHRMVDAMLMSRYQADQKTLQDRGHPELLTRTQLAEKTSEFQRAAREGIAATLSSFEKRVNDADLKNWIALERVYVDLRLKRNYKRAASVCWEILGDAPQPEAVDGPLDEEESSEAYRMKLMQRLLHDRALTTIHYLAVRRSAGESVGQRFLNYISIGEEFDGDLAAGWKERVFTYLVAVDQPDELERRLRKWIRDDAFPAPWQLALGQLMAERGKIDDAISLWETVERTSQLSPSDYQVLADWYLVADRRDQFERARVAVFKSLEEYQIQNWLNQQQQPWYRSDVPLPTQLEENVLFAFRALLEKSNQPGNYASDLRQFYTACRDFRLLEMIPDAVIGSTPQNIYPLLTALRSSVLGEIRKEATSDELLARLRVVRAKSKSVIDSRALDLLEAMIERQAADVLNRPEPHVEAAVDALQRAFKRDWAEGEVRQMAQFLSELGAVAHKAIAEEQLRELGELHRRTEPGTDDRLLVSWYLAHCKFYSYGDRSAGLAIMENALNDIAENYPQGWPAHLNTPLDGYIGLLEAENRFQSGEDYLTEQLRKPLNNLQEHWLIQRRNRLYLQALKNDGRVTLGDRTDLFLNLEHHLLEQFNTSDDEHRRQIVTLMLDMYRTAKDKNIAVYKEQLRDFAFEHFQTILSKQNNHYRDLVNQAGQVVRELLGPRDALAFMISRFENYPKRFANTWEKPWSQHGYQLAQWHLESKAESADLEPRLLAIVLQELRRDLLTRNAVGRYLYHDNYGPRFWKEKSDDFARTAEEVLKERDTSGRSVTYIANYLYDGLELRQRAIEIMLIADKKRLLDTAQQITLCDFLHQQNRHAESIPILEPIVESNPDQMAYRTRMITAYAKSNRIEQMKNLLESTDEYFRQQGRWTESNIAMLAQCCLDNDRFAEAAAYYGEVIPLHQRAHPNRGIGQATLSNYYSQQSRAYAGLDDTIRAVESASAAIVGWGARQEQRDSAIYWLEQAISQSTNLDDYVKHVDEQALQTGQDSPLVRQKIGIVYMKRKNYQQALQQLHLAAELQPTNSQTHEALIEAYEKTDHHEGVVRQVMAQLENDRHNLELFKKLASLLKHNPRQSERAVTTLVEAAPLESEHHQALAEIRESQDRWGDAIVHWKQVANLRSLEPTGLLKLAEAEIHQQNWPAAREAIEKLNQTDWPQRFSNVRSQTESMQKQLP